MPVAIEVMKETNNVRRTICDFVSSSMSMCKYYHDTACTSFTTRTRICMARLMSLADVSRPSEIRKVLLARHAMIGVPAAFACASASEPTTCDSLLLPSLHAALVERARPARASASRSEEHTSELH